MFQRREFLKVAGAFAVSSAATPRLLRAQTAAAEDGFRFTSDSIDAQLSATSPEFLGLTIDGLAKSRRGANIVAPKSTVGGYQASVSNSGSTHRIEYRVTQAASDSAPAWTIELSPNRIVLTSQWSPEYQPTRFFFHFNLNSVHSTVLGLFQNDGLLATPALMHFPGQGSMRLTSSVPIGLTYASNRPQQTAQLSLPGATFEHKRLVYTLDITAIYPEFPGLADERFDAFRRNWLDVLQLNPELQALSNNTASDSCAFCYYEYADIAALTPQLAPGLTALDIVRQTLDRMLAGGWAYGLPGIPDRPSACLDTYPSMIIAAAACVRAGGNDAWLAESYPGIRDWIESLLATDITGNGLVKYGLSGN
jgi:hypothetical protein